MCTKVGDENLVRHPMCVKNRRQMKFWWEKEWDYRNINRASLIIFRSDESMIASRYAYESGWRQHNSSPYVCEK